MWNSIVAAFALPPMPSGPSLPAESTMSVSLNLRLPAIELFSHNYVSVCFQLSSTTLAPGATLPRRTQLSDKPSHNVVAQRCLQPLEKKKASSS